MAFADSTNLDPVANLQQVDRFSAIEPYDHGLLDVGDGQQLYWETSGNPAGKPVVVLHGGPGSGNTPGARRDYDPRRYRIVIFDQRGSGRSTPRVEAFTDLSANTTEHLIADLERLREFLGIERWLVRGNSWGVTLALAYAERYPERVSAMLLASVTMTRRLEIHWLYHETGRFLPAEWDRFRKGVPEQEREGDLVAAYYRLLHLQPDAQVRQKAADDWCEWEDSVAPSPIAVPNPRYAELAFRMTFARIVTHYFHHRAWLRDGQLLDEAHRLAGIPGVMVHGRYDLGGPVDTPWQLAQAWPDAELHVVDTGHGGGDAMTEVILQATNRFANFP